MDQAGKPALGGSGEQAVESGRPDWRYFVGSLLAAGFSFEEINELTLRQAHAAIDGFKLRTYWAAMPMVSYVASKVGDEDLAKSLHGKGNPMRGQLVEQMLRPYAPSWMLEDQSVRSLGGRVIPGLEPDVAEAILFAVEDGLFDDDLWRAVWPLWPSLLETAEKRPGAPPEA